MALDNLWLSVTGRSGIAGDCRVSYVYDGDTVALTCAFNKTVTARVTGLDAPETGTPGCAEERDLGKRATLRLRELVAGGGVTYRRLGHDKYGRELIRLRVGGQDVADTLIDEGLATRYNGGSRINWCRRLGGF